MTDNDGFAKVSHIFIPGLILFRAQAARSHRFSLQLPQKSSFASIAIKALVGINPPFF
jgi:hypothetical protein